MESGEIERERETGTEERGQWGERNGRGAIEGELERGDVERERDGRRRDVT